jgi:hypothetical protein
MAELFTGGDSPRPYPRQNRNYRRGGDFESTFDADLAVCIYNGLEKDLVFFLSSG